MLFVNVLFMQISALSDTAASKSEIFGANNRGVLINISLQTGLLK